MGHHHHHHSDNNLGLAFVLNLVFTIIEFIGGWFTNSLAILSDAVHDLGDSISLGLAWYFERIAKRPVDGSFTYGYKRFSVLGAIINSVILIVGSIFIIINAIPRIMDPQVTHSTGMMILAIVGILFNGAAYWRTHKGQSHNERVVSLHLLEDVLGWVAVLIGAILMYFTGWYLIDPMLSIGIALFILYNVVRNVRQTINIILQGTPDRVDIKNIKSQLVSIPNVLDIHDLHLWTMDGEQNILTAHVVVPGSIDFAQVRHIKERIHSKMKDVNIQHCTLEIEQEGEDCSITH